MNTNKSFYLGLLSVFIGFLFALSLLAIWFYKMAVASDIPVNISLKELLFIFCLSILFLIIYSLYIRITRFYLINMMMLSVPLILWFMSMQQALTYHYQNYDTASDITGFCVTLISFLQLLFFKFKKLNNTNK